MWERNPGIQYTGPREAYLDVECMSQEREFSQDPATEALTLSAFKKKNKNKFMNVNFIHKCAQFRENHSF